MRKGSKAHAQIKEVTFTENTHCGRIGIIRNDGNLPSPIRKQETE
jgi:hypothetical protein